MNQPPPNPNYAWAPPPPPRQSSRLPIVLALGLVLVLVVLGAIAIMAFGPGLAQLGSGTALADVSVGQCFNGGAVPAGTSTTINVVEVVDCAEPHEGELYATFDYSGTQAGGEFPGNGVLASYAEGECVDRFTEYVGIDYNESFLEIVYVHPQAAGWLFGDRSIQCMIRPPVGEDMLTGSMRGARR